MYLIRTNEQPPPPEGVVNNDIPDDSQPDNARVTMADMMQTFIEMAYEKFCKMSEEMNVARDARTIAHRLQTIIEKLEEPDQIGNLSPDVINYMNDHNILVEEQTIDEFLLEKDRIERIVAEGQCSLLIGTPKSAMESINAALESAADNAAYFVQQSQLKLQRLMLNFKTAMTMANSVQNRHATSTISTEVAIR